MSRFDLSQYEKHLDDLCIEPQNGIHKKGDIKLIQVCHLSHIETVNREKRALVTAMKECGINTGLVLTMDEKRQEESTGYFLEISPVWEWLLTNDF